MSHLHVLHDHVVTETYAEHSYVKIAFDGGLSLTINNEVEIVPPSVSMPDLAGRVVDSVDETSETIKIAFIDGVCVEIDMRPEARRGAEALILHRSGHPDTVWK